MARNKEDTINEKEAMKKLREDRKEYIKSATMRMKSQKKAVKAITGLLENDALTVPEIAMGAGASIMETLWYVAALKKYGRVIESEKDGSYFKYTLSQKEAPKNISEGETNNPV